MKTERDRFEEKLVEYKERLKIDKNALDDEVVEQPELFWHVSNEFALAVSQRDSKKESYQRIHAILSRDLRKEIEDKEGKKPTEAAISAAIERHVDYKTRRDEYLHSAFRAQSWKALMESFEQRGHMLKQLVTLFGSNYFQRTSMEGTGKKEEKYNENKAIIRNARKKKRERQRL
jgi:hypothetical protein